MWYILKRRCVFSWKFELEMCKNTLCPMNCDLSFNLTKLRRRDGLILVLHMSVLSFWVKELSYGEHMCLNMESVFT